MQNKSIRFCLRLDKMLHISLTEFIQINWLPTKEIVYQCINTITFKFVNSNCPIYLKEIFKSAPTNTGQETLSYIGPSLQNNPKTIKETNNLDTFKSNVRNIYLNQETDAIVTMIIQDLCQIIIITITILDIILLSFF